MKKGNWAGECKPGRKHPLFNVIKAPGANKGRFPTCTPVTSTAGATSTYDVVSKCFLCLTRAADQLPPRPHSLSLFVCPSRCLRLCLLSLSPSDSLSLTLCPCLCLSVSVCLSSLSLCLSVCLSLCLSLSLSVCLCVSVCFCLCLSLSLCLCLSVSLSLLCPCTCHSTSLHTLPVCIRASLLLFDSLFPCLSSSLCFLSVSPSLCLCLFSCLSYSTAIALLRVANDLLNAMDEDKV